MSQEMNCRICDRELRGAIELCFAGCGGHLLLLVNETPDCNWTRCKWCHAAICKKCQTATNAFCCFQSLIRSMAHKEARQKAERLTGLQDFSNRKAS